MLWAVGVLFGLQVGLEDRLQDQHRSHLYHAIFDARNSSGLCLLSLWGCIRAEPAGTDVPFLSSSARLSNHRSRLYPRYPQSSGRRPPVRDRWHGSERRRNPGHHGGRSCRTARRSDSRASSSFRRATSSATSQPSSEVLGSCQSPGCRPLTTSTLNSAPSLDRRYPASTVLRAYLLPRRPGLSLAGVRSRVSAFTAWGFPCCVALLVQTCRRHYPGGAPVPVVRETVYSSRLHTRQRLRPSPFQCKV